MASLPHVVGDLVNHLAHQIEAGRVDHLGDALLHRQPCALRHPHKLRGVGNAEVLAQGWANMGSALFGGMPATGAIARTATNVRAGGTTPVAGIVHALTIFMVMMIAAPLAGYLAMPALAALLLITAWNMSEPHKWRGYWSAPASERTLLILTLALTVLSDLTVAIGVGVALGLMLRLRTSKVEPEDWSEPER